MSTKVIFIGEKCQGVIEFEKPIDGKKFYFNNRLDEFSSVTLLHDNEEYRPRERLELKE